MTNFPAKNEARRRARANPKTFRRAREARKRYATNGAFGSYGKDSPIYELCAYGTKPTGEDG